MELSKGTVLVANIFRHSITYIYQLITRQKRGRIRCDSFKTRKSPLTTTKNTCFTKREEEREKWVADP